ncbi:alpha-keto acid decarboxylase family protein [Terrilactibacillus laevilacticus]|uniref:Alpha-keto-acid decarboxylase n=1 Tax=Terrilactibacillus laevilacticus TaxID=1380157 RepID=A0ABW5PPH6_9BACI|nr:alpha-keto acid decarboxylase family protein [Terrilactibacillus laevilacticus]
MEYTIGRYLIDRLAELGIRHIFGVPGDYNLSFLDDIVDHPALEWVGNCNELNASYAADGYARIHGISALVTTFGVGELSAINGIAGSYAEEVPVVKITGAPSTVVSNAGKLVHHTLGDGDFHHFSRMFSEVSVAQTTLNEQNATDEIDRVLRLCVLKKKPVHITLPVDIHSKPATMPKTALLENLPQTDTNTLNKLIRHLLPVIEKATSPVILADYQVYRYDAYSTLKTFAEKTGFPVATLSMGKGVFDEDHPQHIGVYSGKTSTPYLRKRIDSSDCIICIGVRLTDSITSGFSQGFSEQQVIHIMPHGIRYQDDTWENIEMVDALTALSTRITKRGPETLDIKPILSQDEYKHLSSFYAKPEQPILQERFWELMHQFIQKDDVLIADQGTAYFGLSTIPLKEHVTFIGQPLWGSIGYTLPALLGTQLADPTRRNILFIGDGAFQLTFQEISTMARQQIKPIIFVFNNDGYTVERAIHGEKQVYNDIQMWNYAEIPSVLGAKSNQVKVSTEGELIDALKNTIANTDTLHFIEVVMDRMDMPELLNKVGKALAAQNN